MAMGLAGRVAMKFPFEREMELIGKVAHTFASKGVTAVQDMRPELGYDLGQYEAFARLAQKGELNVRVHSAANLLTGIDEILEKGEKFNSDVFRICLLKQYMDGVPTTHTAMVADGYKDRPGYKGSPINDPENASMRRRSPQKRTFRENTLLRRRGCLKGARYIRGRCEKVRTYGKQACH